MLMIGALVTADRALVSASDQAATIDARESSLLIQQLLALRVDALSAFHAPLMSPEAERRREFDELATHIANERGGPRALWVTDSAGHVLYQTDSALTRVAGRTPSAISVAISNDHHTRALIVLAPLLANGRPVGTMALASGAGNLHLHNLAGNLPPGVDPVCHLQTVEIRDSDGNVVLEKSRLFSDSAAAP